VPSLKYITILFVSVLALSCAHQDHTSRMVAESLRTHGRQIFDLRSKGSSMSEAEREVLDRIIEEAKSLSPHATFREVVGGGFIFGTFGEDNIAGNEDDFFLFWPSE